MYRHGLSIGLERIEDKFFLTLKAIGKLSHSDYEKITPMIDSALDGIKQPEVRAFIDATELEGWELRAAWDDFKLGLKHGTSFSRIAIAGNKKWQKNIARIGSWFVTGQVKYFETADSALQWLFSEE